MADSILSRVGPGIDRGMQIADFMQKKRQAEFAKDMTTTDLLFKLGANKTLDTKQRTQFLSKGGEIIKKWYPDIQIPDAETVPPDLYQEWGASNAEVIKGIKKGDIPIKVGAATIRANTSELMMKLAARGEALDEDQMKNLKALTDLYPDTGKQDEMLRIQDARLRLNEDRLKGVESERDIREEERRRGRFKNYLETIELRDPIIKEAKKQSLLLADFDGLMNLVKEGNTVAFSTLGAKAARSLAREVGVLTETDINRYVTSGRLDRKAADTLSKWTKGKATQATVDEIGQIADVMQDTYESKIQPQYDKWIEKYSKIEKLAPEQFAAEIGLPYTGGEKKGAKTPEEEAAAYLGGG